MGIRTRKFPGIVAVDVEDSDHVEVQPLLGDHLLEVEIEELLFGRMEPKPREIESWSHLVRRLS